MSEVGQVQIGRSIQTKAKMPLNQAQGLAATLIGMGVFKPPENKPPALLPSGISVEKPIGKVETDAVTVQAHPSQARAALEKTAQIDTNIQESKLTEQPAKKDPKIEAEKMLKYLTALDSDAQIEISRKTVTVGTLKKKQQEVMLVQVKDSQGKEVRSFTYAELKKSYEKTKADVNKKRITAAISCIRNFGASLTQLGYRIEVDDQDPQQLFITNKNNHTKVTITDFIQSLDQSKPTASEGIKNCQKRFGKKKGLEFYISNETSLGKAAKYAFSERERKFEAKKTALEYKKQLAEAKQQKFSKALVETQKILLAAGKPLTYLNAITRASTSLLAYDWNPLRPLFGVSIGKLWTHEWKNGVSGRELAARLEEKLLVDPITGKATRSGAISQEKLREAVMGGIDWAMRMNLLPQVLSTLPIISTLNLKPQEIYSMYRSTNMVRSGVGSISQFIEIFQHAKSPQQKTALTLTALASAPIFLIAEKICPAWKNVNPVLMADIGLMRLVGKVQEYSRENALKSTYLGNVLESVEIGITGAFAFDSATSVGKRVTSYLETGSTDFNLSPHLKNEQQLINIVQNHPEYFSGKGGGVFGSYEKAEENFIAHLMGKTTAEKQPQSTAAYLLKDNQGVRTYYSVKANDDGTTTIVKQNLTGIAVYANNVWTKIELPTETAKQPVAENAAYEQAATNQTEQLSSNKDMADLPPNLLNIENNLTTAVHDYVYYTKDGSKLAFRMDLTKDDTIDTKINRLFSGAYDDDKSAVIPTGEQVKDLSTADLAKIAGKDGVYEAEIYRDLIQKMLTDAKADNRTGDMDIVKARFKEVLQKNFTDQKTFEGEIAYQDLYKYLFPQKDIPAQENTIEIKPGDVLINRISEFGYTLSSEGIYDASGVKVNGAQIFKIVDGNTVAIPFGSKDLSLIYPKDQFILRIPGTAAKETIQLPTITKTVEAQKEAESLKNAPTIDTTANKTELTKEDIDKMWQEKVYRNDQNQIFLGTVEKGDTLSKIIINRFKDTFTNPWSTLAPELQKMTANGVKIYVINDKGEKVRFYNSYQELGSISIGDKLVLEDSKGIWKDKIKQLPTSIEELAKEQTVNKDLVPDKNQKNVVVEPQKDLPQGNINGFTLDGKIDLTHPSDKLIRDIDGEVFVSTISSGMTLRSVFQKAFGDNQAYDKFLDLYTDRRNTGVDIYAVRPDGSIRNFTPDTLNMIYVGDKIVIKDPQEKLSGITNYIDIIKDVTIINIPVSDSEKANRAQQDTLIDSNLQRVIKDSNIDSTKVGIVIYDPVTQETISIGENNQFYPASLAKLATAELILKQVDEGKINLTDQCQYAVRAQGYIPTIEQVLNDLIVFSSDQAFSELTAQLTGEKDLSDKKTDAINQLYQNELGLTATKFGTLAKEGNDAVTTPVDMMKVLKLTTDPAFLSPKSRLFINNLLDYAGDRNGTVNKELEIYGGVNVSEKIGIGAFESANNHENHTMAKITTSDGKSYYLVVMTNDASANSEQLIENIARESLTVFDPQAVNNQSHFYSTAARILRDDPLVQTEYVSHLLFPTYTNTGDYQLNNDLQKSLGAWASDLVNWDHQITPYADGSTEVKFSRDEAGQSRQVLVFVDKSGNVISALDNKQFADNQIDFVDMRTSPDTNLPLADKNFEDFSGATSIHIQAVSGQGYTPSDQTRQLLFNSIQNYSTQAYDYVIFSQGGAGKEPIIGYGRPYQDRGSGSVKNDLRIAIFTNSKGQIDDSELKAVQELIDKISSTSGKIAVSDIAVGSMGSTKEISITNNQSKNLWIGKIVDNLRLDISPETKFKYEDNLRSDLVIPAVGIFKGISFDQLNSQDQQQLSQSYNKVADLITSINQEFDRNTSIISKSEFENKIFSDIANKSTTLSDNAKLTYATADILQAAGIDDSAVIANGVRYFNKIWLPTNQNIDVANLAKELNIDTGKLVVYQTKNSGEYLLGEKIEGSAALAKSTFKVSNETLFYQVRTGPGDTDYELRSTPPDNPNDLLAVFPLDKNIDSVVPFEKMKDLGTDVKAHVQYLNGEYLLGSQIVPVDLGKEFKFTKLYVNTDTMEVYGLASKVENGQIQSQLYPFAASYLTFSDMATALDIKYTNTKSLTNSVIKERLLQTIETNSRNTDHFMQKEGQEILDTSRTGEGLEPLTIREDVGFQQPMFDSKYHLLYSNESNNKFYTFNADKQQFIEADKSQFKPAVDILSDFAQVTGDHNLPLQYRGMPVLSKDDIMYVLSPQGLTAVGTIYSKGEFNFVEDNALPNLWDLSKTVAWQKEISYADLGSDDERLLHSIALESKSLLETKTGLVDAKSGEVLILGSDNNQILYDSDTARPLLHSDQNPDVYFRVGQTGELEQVDNNKVINQTQFKQIFNINSPFKYQVGKKTIELIDRQTRLPVYLDSRNKLVLLDGKGVDVIGNDAGLLQSGLIGYVENGVYKTVSQQEIDKQTASILTPLQDKIVQGITSFISKPVNDLVKTLAKNEKSTQGVSLESIQMLQGTADYLTYDKMPKKLIQAVMSSEDKTIFTQSQGEEQAIYLPSVLRYLLTLGKSGGVSTISTQVGE